jgi:curved DNA-binding protein CbpA
MYELENAYRLLDLEPGASMEEVNQAYKDLVFIWHPDRLPKDNQRLIAKAQEKIKQLNQARDYLRTHARVGTSAAANGNTAYRSRTRPYSRNATESAYRQRPTHSTDNGSRSNHQPPQNPGQSRYAQSSYGTYGTYRSAASNSTNPQYYTYNSNGRATNPPSNGYPDSTSEGTPGAASKGNAASRSPDDGWNNYTSSRVTDNPSNAHRQGESRDRSASASSYSYRPSPQYRSASPRREPEPTAPSPRKPNPDLSGSDFRGANLREKDFSGRNLSNADLAGADLQDAFLHRVNLNRADLSNANLFRANLLQANLSHANLRGANLLGADLSGADLSGADLSGAKVSVGDRMMVKLTGTILRGTIMPDGTINA